MLPTSPPAELLQVVGLRGRRASLLGEPLRQHVTFLPIINGAGKMAARPIIIVAGVKPLMKVREAWREADVGFSVSGGVETDSWVSICFSLAKQLPKGMILLIDFNFNALFQDCSEYTFKLICCV